MRQGWLFPAHQGVEPVGHQCLWLRLLKWKQEKLQEDPRFIEKIAREDLGYAKPGETVFRFEEAER